MLVHFATRTLMLVMIVGLGSSIATADNVNPDQFPITGASSSYNKSIAKSVSNLFLDRSAHTSNSLQELLRKCNSNEFFGMKFGSTYLESMAQFDIGDTMLNDTRDDLFIGGVSNTGQLLKILNDTTTQSWLDQPDRLYFAFDHPALADFSDSQFAKEVAATTALLNTDENRHREKTGLFKLSAEPVPEPDYGYFVLFIGMGIVLFGRNRIPSTQYQ